MWRSSPKNARHALPPPVSVSSVVGIAGWKIAMRCCVVDCCARAADGQARAAAPMSVMNARRFMGFVLRPNTAS
jgi:hypothetical protein